MLTARKQTRCRLGRWRQPGRCRWLGLALLVALLVSPRSVLAIADAAVNGGPNGVAGVQKVEPGNEVQIYSVSLVDNLGNGVFVDLGLPGTNPGIRIIISDLSRPTGIRSSDFDGLRLYRSADNVLDAGDTPMAFAATVPVNGVNYTELDVSGLPIGGLRRVPVGAGTWFIIAAAISPAANRGHAFRVSATAENIGIDESGFPPFLQDGLLPTPGVVIPASDGNSVIIGDQVSYLPGSGKAGGIAIPFGGEGVILLALLASGGWVLCRRH